MLLLYDNYRLYSHIIFFSGTFPVEIACVNTMGYELCDLATQWVLVPASCITRKNKLLTDTD